MDWKRHRRKRWWPNYKKYCHTGSALKTTVRITWIRSQNLKKKAGKIKLLLLTSWRESRGKTPLIHKLEESGKRHPPSAFSSEEKQPELIRTGSWVSTTVGRYVTGKRTTPFPCQVSNPWSSSPYTSHYSDWAASRRLLALMRGSFRRQWIHRGWRKSLFTLDVLTCCLLCRLLHVELFLK